MYTHRLFIYVCIYCIHQTHAISVKLLAQYPDRLPETWQLSVHPHEKQHQSTRVVPGNAREQLVC